MISYFVAKIVYNLTWIPWYLTFRFFLNYEVKYKDASVKKMRGPLIIAANHSSWLDPFFISGIFPIFSAIFPIRFAIDMRFLYYPHTAISSRIYGSFGVKRGVGLEKVLAPAVEFLKQKQVVGIFPEGKKRHFGRPKRGGRGAAYLSIKTRAPILPCKIEGDMGLAFTNFIHHKNKVTIYVGVPFRLPKNINNPQSAEDLNIATDIIMKKIGNLHV